MAIGYRLSAIGYRLKRRGSVYLFADCRLLTSRRLIAIPERHAERAYYCEV